MASTTASRQTKSAFHGGEVEERRSKGEIFLWLASRGFRRCWDWKGRRCARVSVCVVTAVSRGQTGCVGGGEQEAKGENERKQHQTAGN